MQQCQIQIMFPNSEFEICSQISALLWPPPPPSEVRGQKSAEMQMRVQGFQKNMKSQQKIFQNMKTQQKILHFKAHCMK